MKAEFIRHLAGQCDSYAKLDRRKEYVVDKTVGREKARELAAEELGARGFDTFTDVSNDCPSKLSLVRDGYWAFVGFNREDLRSVNQKLKS